MRFPPQPVQLNDLSYFDPFAALTFCCFCAPSISVSTRSQSSKANPSTLPRCSYNSLARHCALRCRLRSQAPASEVPELSTWLPSESLLNGHCHPPLRMRRRQRQSSDDGHPRWLRSTDSPRPLYFEAREQHDGTLLPVASHRRRRPVQPAAAP
jgi:hypothetical protein